MNLISDNIPFICYIKAKKGASTMEHLSGKKIQNLRQQNNLTQKELGMALGYSARQILRIENNESPINLKFAQRCADYFNIDINELLPASEATIGNRLRQARIHLNLSQKELSVKLHKTPQQISNYENGIANVSPEVKKILELDFKISSEWLETGTGSMFISNHSDSEYDLAVQRLKRMNTSDLKRILSYIDKIEKSKDDH